MKTITIEDDLYTFIASQTKHIGESASDILRRLLMPEGTEIPASTEFAADEEQDNSLSQPVIEEAEIAQDEEPQITEAEAQQVVATSGSGDVFQRINDMNIDPQSSRVEQFLSILSALHGAHAAEFAKVLEVKGRNRLYFAKSKEELLKSGSSTNPKQVPGSQFWVVTNNNTAKKVSMLTQVTNVLNYSADDSKKLAALFAPELA